MFDGPGYEDHAPEWQPFAEPAVVLSEANHRISNNLSLLASMVSLRAAEISRRGADMSSADVALLLDEFGSRIVAIGLLHRLLAARPLAVQLDFNTCLRQLCNALIDALAPPGRVELEWVSDCACPVAARKVLPLSLIATELLTNSLKYAHPAGVRGKLAVECGMAEDGSLLLEIADDGVGLPEGFEIASDGGFGMRTIALLANDLGAELRFGESAIGLRAIVRLEHATA